MFECNKGSLQGNLNRPGQEHGVLGIQCAAMGQGDEHDMVLIANGIPLSRLIFCFPSSITVAHQGVLGPVRALTN
jgi:hypothetical protein